MLKLYIAIGLIFKYKKLNIQIDDEQLNTHYVGRAYKSLIATIANKIFGLFALLGGAVFVGIACLTPELNIVFFSIAAVFLLIGYVLLKRSTSDRSSPSMLPGETFDAGLMENRLQKEVYDHMQAAGIQPAKD